MKVSNYLYSCRFGRPVKRISVIYRRELGALRGRWHAECARLHAPVEPHLRSSLNFGRRWCSRCLCWRSQQSSVSTGAAREDGWQHGNKPGSSQQLVSLSSLFNSGQNYISLSLSFFCSSLPDQALSFCDIVRCFCIGTKICWHCQNNWISHFQFFGFFFVIVNIAKY